MKTNSRKQRGYTIIELMIAMALMALISGVVFQQITTAQQRSAHEQVKLDLFQETRDFMDQMTRDLHQAGYPNIRNFTDGTITSVNDQRVAIGLVKMDYNHLWFEGDVDGTGTVSSVQYYIDNEGDDCPCLKRSQIGKITADPLTGQGTPSFQTEVQHVQNGTSSTDAIFFAYDANNNLITTLPIDYKNDPATIASIATIKVALTAQSPIKDLKTNLRPSINMVSTVKLNNCSMATSSKPMSCQ